MRFLYVDTYVHHKNRIGFILMCKAKNIELVITKDMNKFHESWDLVFVPSEYIHPKFFPNTKHIMYGPQNFVFVNGPWLKGATYFPPNCFYNLLSDWVIDVQNEMGGLSLESKSIPFAVDIEKFSPKQSEKKYDCFVYFKNRNLADLAFIEEELKERNLHYTVLHYGHYKEDDYLEIIHNSRFGIWVGGSESQGFALEESLSCNVPLLVWNCTNMFQVYDSNNKLVMESYIGKCILKCTSIPYWDSRCGLVFTEKAEFSNTLTRMLTDYLEFEPRNFILETLSPEVCVERLLKEIEKT